MDEADDESADFPHLFASGRELDWPLTQPGPAYGDTIGSMNIDAPNSTARA